ncbi:alpha/beta hydrolase [Microbacterium sp. bgisy203]|uniref:alpha/beta hydrolase n=1 Tax=Microbacterium sp. bgisy203 TaxID=3413799 RepID=UPI003D704B7D
MTSAPTLPPVLHEPPAGTRVRGVLALIAGAGEGADVYARFGRRLAFDGYVVGVFSGDDTARTQAWLVAQEPGPRVLVGSDRGAAIALTAAAGARGAGIDGVIVAGLPIAGRDDASASPEERSACPVHLGVLAAQDAPGDTRSAAAIPGDRALAGIRVPVLAIHGGADPIAPVGTARETLAAVPELEFVETVDGLHDALNDQSHRSVAATIVLWLERLRAGSVEQPIVRHPLVEAARA